MLRCVHFLNDTKNIQIFLGHKTSNHLWLVIPDFQVNVCELISLYKDKTQYYTQVFNVCYRGAAIAALLLYVVVGGSV